VSETQLSPTVEAALGKTEGRLTKPSDYIVPPNWPISTDWPFQGLIGQFHDFSETDDSGDTFFGVLVHFSVVWSVLQWLAHFLYANTNQN
jgi:hypothetical protein